MPPLTFLHGLARCVGGVLITGGLLLAMDVWLPPRVAVVLQLLYGPLMLLGIAATVYLSGGAR